MESQRTNCTGLNIILCKVNQSYWRIKLCKYVVCPAYVRYDLVKELGAGGRSDVPRQVVHLNKG